MIKVFDMQQELGRADFSVFLKEHKDARVKDERKMLLAELAEVRNPDKRTDPELMQKIVNEFVAQAVKEIPGSWVYFSWKNFLLWYLPEDLHNELRTARNKNCITLGEQEAFYNFPMALAGLSVGSHVALTTVLMGGCKFMNIADPDAISGSNLNRIRYGFDDVGEKKVDVAARRIYEMNPYARLKIFPQGAQKENFDDFILSAAKEKVKILIEETDNLALKVRMRVWAKRARLPVIMATDNSDGVIVDVERYDLEPDLKIFGGRVSEDEIPEDSALTPEKRAELATKIVNPKDVEPRMLASVMEVGKTLYSWPQLGNAATLAGVVVAYLVKRIATGGELKTQRVCISFDKMFN